MGWARNKIGFIYTVMITIKLVPNADGKIVLSQGLQEKDGYEFRREITTQAKKGTPPGASAAGGVYGWGLSSFISHPICGLDTRQEIQRTE